MTNLTINLDEDECPPLTEADFKKMRCYPKSKSFVEALKNKDTHAKKMIERDNIALTKKAVSHLNLRAS